jgi:hypothetical protein
MHYIYQTQVGVFSIVQKGNRWHIIYREEDLGNYHTPRAAASDLSGGHTFSPSNGVDPGTLGIPEDLTEWETKYS